MRRLVYSLLALVCGEWSYRLDTQPTQLEIASFPELMAMEDSSTRGLSADAAYQLVREELARRRMDDFVIPENQFIREFLESERIRLAKAGETRVSSFTKIASLVMQTARQEPAGITLVLTGSRYCYGFMVGNGRIEAVYRHRPA